MKPVKWVTVDIQYTTDYSTFVRMNQGIEDSVWFSSGATSLEETLQHGGKKCRLYTELNYGAISLVLPESISLFLSYFNLEIPATFK